MTDICAHWLGHQLYAEMNVEVAPQLSVENGHATAKEVWHQAMHHVGRLANLVVHIDPMPEAGEEFHRIHAHTHDDPPVHSHQPPR